MHDAALATPLLAADSPLDRRARDLIEDLFRKEQAKALALPTDDPLDPKRRARVDFTRPEILEQPDCIRKTLASQHDAVRDIAADLAKAPLKRIALVGCGDSLAVMVAVRKLFEDLLDVPTEPMQALDFAYYFNRPLGPETLVVTLSSSGVTTRTVEAMLMARARGARTLALSNTPGSALMEFSDRGLLVQAERKGWPTQASTAAIALLADLAIAIARARKPSAEAETLAAALAATPATIGSVIGEHEAAIEKLAIAEAARSVYLFAGAGPSYAAALFGAAKIKECTPDHAIAIPLEEFHHYNSQKAGDPLFIVAPSGPSVPRARDTAAEGRRWGGTIFSVVTDGDTSLDGLSDAVIALPKMPEALSALVYTVPLQLFAYHSAMAKFRAAERDAAA